MAMTFKLGYCNTLWKKSYYNYCRGQELSNSWKTWLWYQSSYRHFNRATFSYVTGKLCISPFTNGAIRLLKKSSYNSLKANLLWRLLWQDSHSIFYSSICPWEFANQKIVVNWCRHLDTDALQLAWHILSVKNVKRETPVTFMNFFAANKQKSPMSLTATQLL